MYTRPPAEKFSGGKYNKTNYLIKLNINHAVSLNFLTFVFFFKFLEVKQISSLPIAQPSTSTLSKIKA